MSDTQWPRFQVFLQEKENAPHEDVGTVHAADTELALLNARDVFVRRPDCISLWVAPADAIYSKTAEELAGGGLEEEGDSPGASREPYHVFWKLRSAGTQTHLGSVEAASSRQALKLAIEKYGSQEQPFVWWVIPARMVKESAPEDIQSFFAPARDKPFRLSTHFRTHSTMKQMKREQGRGQRMNNDKE